MPHRSSRLEAVPEAPVEIGEEWWRLKVDMVAYVLVDEMVERRRRYLLMPCSSKGRSTKIYGLYEKYEIFASSNVGWLDYQQFE